MDISEIQVGQLVWLVMNGVKQVKLKVVNKDQDPIKCRFPDGHLEEVYSDELEPI